MYLCICNGLNESRIRAAVEEEGAATLAAIYRTCGVNPRCGKCGDAIRDFARSCRAEACPAPAPLMLAAE